MEPQGKVKSRCERKLRNSENRFNALDMERLKNLSYDPEVENAVTDFHTDIKDAFSLIRSVLPDLYIKDLEQVITRLQAMSSGFSRLEEIISSGNNLMPDALEFHSDFVRFSKEISKSSDSNIDIGNIGVNATGHSTPSTKESMAKSKDVLELRNLAAKLAKTKKIAITTLGTNNTDSVFELINKDSVTWGIGPEVKKGDFVLLYFPKGLFNVMKTLVPDGVKKYGIRFLFRVANDSYTKEDSKWNHEVLLEDKVELKTPVSLEMMKNDKILQDWNLVKMNFRTAGKEKDYIETKIAQALWPLILSKNSYLLEHPVFKDITSSDFFIRTRAIQDTWTDNDLLEYEPYVHAITSPILKGITKPPITIAIQAPWGQGKTSLMKMIQNKIDPEHVHLDKQSSARNLEPRTSTTFRKLIEWAKSDKNKNLQPEKVSIFRRLFRWSIPDNNKNSQQEYFLKTEGRIPTVWFNPLYYRKSEQIWAGLAHAILNQLSSQIEGKLKREEFWFKLQLSRINIETIRNDLNKLVLTKVIPNIIYSSLAGIGLIFFLLLQTKTGKTLSVGAGISTPLIFSIIDYFCISGKRYYNKHLDKDFTKYVSEPDYGNKLGLLHFVDTDLDRAKKLLVGSGPLAIFIDDLDRCDPEVVREVILAINQFLSLPHRNIIFFLGMDMEIVANALEKSNNDNAGIHNYSLNPNKSFGWQFMDKFVQLPFFIPHLENEVAEKYFKEILIGKESIPTTIAKGTDDDVMLADIENSKNIDDVANIMQKNKPSSSSAKIKSYQIVSDRLSELLHPNDVEIQHLVEIAISDLKLELNPRVMKRYLSLVSLLLNVLIICGNWKNDSDYNRKLILRAAHLIISWPKLIRWFQGGTCHYNNGEKITPIETINSLIKDCKDFNSWEEKAKEYCKKSDLHFLIDEGLYHFLRTIYEDPPSLSEMYKARMF